MGSIIKFRPLILLSMQYVEFWCACKNYITISHTCRRTKLTCSLKLEIKLTQLIVEWPIWTLPHSWRTKLVIWHTLMCVSLKRIFIIYIYIYMFTYFLNKANNFLNILQMLRLFPIAGNQQYQSLRHWLNNHMKKLEQGWWIVRNPFRILEEILRRHGRQEASFCWWGLRNLG